MQDALMKFDPAFGTSNPYPSHAVQYRAYHGAVAWLYDPWTGKQRDPKDIGTDVLGYLIKPSVLPLPQVIKEVDILDFPVPYLDLSVRTHAVLAAANVETLRDLVGYTEKEALRIINLGRRSLNEIKTCIAKLGLALKD